LSIQGQRYASDGSPQGGQFQVNTYTTGDQRNASVAVEAGGDFVVVWDSLGSDGTDSSYRSVQAQRYASDGSAQGAQFQANTYTTQSQFRPSVATDAGGGFVVVWDSNGSSGTDVSLRSIQGQRYDSGGSAQGGEFQVNTFTTGYQRYPSVAADAAGDFVVVWQSYGSYGTDTSGYSVQGQRYDSGGSAQGAEFQVNTYTTFSQNEVSVAAAADGDFVVVWQSFGSTKTDQAGISVNGQRYDSGGSAQGAEFQVNTYETGNQRNPSVAAEPDGDFVVVWSSAGSSGTDTSGTSSQGQRYASDGSMQGAQFQVNTYTTNYQRDPAVTVDPDGAFVVVWEAYAPPTETSSNNINGQRYGLAPTPPAVPAMSFTTRFALGAAMLLLGAAYALRRRA
jgi:hypothetical protein